jgi:hypothetical protein
MNETELVEMVTDEGLPLPPRVRKILDTAKAEGWQLNGKGATFALRFDKPDDVLAVPFFMMWQLVPGTEGKLSWRFMNAATATLQPLNYNDALKYLQDTTVIYAEEEANADQD